MKAKFIGQDYMGWKNGEVYDIRTEVKQIRKSTGSILQPYIILPCLCVYDNNNNSWCPYSRLETMLKNWQLIDGKCKSRHDEDTEDTAKHKCKGGCDKSCKRPEDDIYSLAKVLDAFYPKFNEVESSPESTMYQCILDDLRACGYKVLRNGSGCHKIVGKDDKEEYNEVN